MDRYIIYGMIEPATKKVVFIDYYIWTDNYPNVIDLYNCSIDIMNTGEDETENEYWRDLYNLYEYNNVETVVLDIANNERKAQLIVQEFRDRLKPRYNVNRYID